MVVKDKAINKAVDLFKSISRSTILILIVLHNAKKPLRAIEIAKRAGITKRTVYRELAKLTIKGIMQKENIYYNIINEDLTYMLLSLIRQIGI